MTPEVEDPCAPVVRELWPGLLVNAEEDDCSPPLAALGIELPVEMKELDICVPDVEPWLIVLDTSEGED